MEKKLPEHYFTEQMDYRAALILRFVYMSFGVQIFVCRLDQFQLLITALGYGQIKTSSTDKSVPLQT